MEGVCDAAAKNGVATSASTTMKARMVSPLARRAEEGRCGLSGSAPALGSQADARPALPPCFTGHTEGRGSGPGKTVRLVTRLWNINCHSHLRGQALGVASARTASTQLVAVSRHGEGPGKTARGLRWSQSCVLTLRREISE